MVIAPTTIASAPPTAITGECRRIPALRGRDEFRDESEEIAENQIAHREQAPELCRNGPENQFRMPAVRHGMTNRHFLHNEANSKCEDNKRNEETDAETRTRGTEYSCSRIIFAEKNQNSGANEKPEESNAAHVFDLRPFQRARATCRQCGARSTSSCVRRPASPGATEDAAADSVVGRTAP